MFSKEMLQGILISCPKPECNITKNDASSIGYRVRLKISFRGNENFLLALQRTLLQHGITSTLKERESKTRPKPILKITKNSEIGKVLDILPPKLDNSNVEWDDFMRIFSIVYNGKHLSLEGFEDILKIKELV